MANDEAATNLGRIRSVLLRLVGGELVLLLLTGAYLTLWYRPSSSWGAIYAAESRATLSATVQGSHRIVAWVTVATTVGLAVVCACEALVRWEGAPRRPLVLLAGPALAVVVIAATLTGNMVAWDQLALRSVTVGSDLSGYGPLFGDEVLFALVGGAEVRTDTMRTWVLVHVAALPVAAAALVSVLVQRRGVRPNAAAPEPQLVRSASEPTG